jgi:hypothetical protein
MVHAMRVPWFEDETCLAGLMFPPGLIDQRDASLRRLIDVCELDDW